jgi:HK97 family phage prohead protease
MEEERRSIWIPIKKNYETNEYRAILSDTSIDRDGERMSRSLLQKWANSPNAFIPMLMDHKNEIMNMVGQWTDPVLVENGDSSALMMKPKWFLSNPNAQILKGMLDEGAELGLSIGAIPKDSVVVKTANDTKVREWTDAELLEASLTPIGSNRNSFINIAKSFGINEEKQKIEKMAIEEKIMKSEEVQEEVLEVESETELDEAEEESEVEKTLLEELASLRKEISALKKANNRKAVLKAHSENSEVATPVEAVKKNLSVWEQMAVLKGIKNYGENW